MEEWNVLHRGPAHAGAEVPCFSEGETAIGYAGIWPWRMTLTWRGTAAILWLPATKGSISRYPLGEHCGDLAREEEPAVLLWQIGTDNTERKWRVIPVRSHRLPNQEGEVNETMLNQPKEAFQLRWGSLMRGFYHPVKCWKGDILEANTQKCVKHRLFQSRCWTVQIKVGLSGFAVHLYRRNGYEGLW